MKKDNATVAERKAKALQLRARGKNYRDIAKELGYAGPSGAYRIIQDALKDSIKEAADEVKDLELERLDHLLTFYWDKASRGDVKAGQMILGIMDRRAKLLGLNSATQVEEQLTVEYVNDWRGKAEDLADIENKDAGKLEID